MQRWQIRVAPSLGGGFERTPHEAWGIKDRHNCAGNCVFFGLYGMKDFHELMTHEGHKAILWCGSDIRHYINGYWLDREGKYRISPEALASYLNSLENYVENKVEYNALKKVGIESKIVPSFLGDVTKYEIEYQLNNVELYTSVSGDDFELYGWDKINKLAKENPKVTFHLYGNKTKWKSPHKNVIVHGRVPQEQLIAETKKMTGALRLTKFDGFSEIVARSLLWGQYPVSTIPYPYTIEPQDIHTLWDNKHPNKEGREWLLKNVNKFPWNVNLN